LAGLAAVAEERIFFRPHQYLAREAERPDVLYCIDEGWACRFRLLGDGRRQITALFLPGDYCEPHWILGGRPAQSIVAITNIRAVAIPCGAWRDGTPYHQGKLLSSVISMIERQADWLVTLGRKTALERVAHLLCDVYERMSRSGLSYGQQCSMPLTQMDIADVTGLTPVHVNRTLQTMRTMKLIELQSKWLRIPDLAALRQSAALAPAPR